MKLSEKQWVCINRFIMDGGQPRSIDGGIGYQHPKLPFELCSTGMRFARNRDNELDISLYRVIEWRGEGWVARRTYIERNLRYSNEQTFHSLEGDLEKADEDMVLALLMVPQAKRPR